MTKARPIAVIGGGIAGASAVLTLAQHGHTPLWFAVEDTRTDRVGESLAPAAHRTLKALGVTDLLDASQHRRSNATFSSWGGDALMERNAITQMEGSGWVLDRAGFERDLVARAAEQVVPVSRPVQSVTRDDEGWVLSLDGGEMADARFVLDATGRSAILGRQFSTLKRTDQLVAVWGILEHHNEGVDPTQATLIEAVEDGWWYAALLPDGRLVVAWFTDPDLIKTGLSQDLNAWTVKLTGSRYVHRWIEDAGFAPVAPPTLASAGTTWLEDCAGDGWAAIGDAAAAFDPLSSHGMTTALWSGHAAALALIAEQGGKTGALQSYARQVGDGVETFLEQRQRFYGAERRFSDAPFWVRRQG